MASIICPKCGKSQPGGRTECIHCGVIFKKIPKSKQDKIPNKVPESSPASFLKNHKEFLITCPECKYKISAPATICPACGYSFPKLTTGHRIAGFVIISSLFIAMAYFGFFYHPNIDTSPSTSRDHRIKNSFSSWDGSHKGLTEFIKKTMHDPDSYKHVETKYRDDGDYLFVRTTFRGKNAFGGIVTNWVYAKVDIDGNVIEILDKGP